MDEKKYSLRQLRGAWYAGKNGDAFLGGDKNANPANKRNSRQSKDPIEERCRRALPWLIGTVKKKLNQHNDKLTFSRMGTFVNEFGFPEFEVIRGFMTQIYPSEQVMEDFSKEIFHFTLAKFGEIAAEVVDNSLWHRWDEIRVAHGEMSYM